MTFNEATEYWIFCGSRLLIHKLQRARPLAQTLDDHGVLQRMWTLLTQELIREGKEVPQKNLAGLYAGPVLRDRFQVMEQVVGGEFYVIDLLLEDLVIRERRDGQIRTFTTVKQAEDFIEVFTPPEQHVTTPKPRLNIAPSGRAQQHTGTGEDEMARTAKTVAKKATAPPKNGRKPVAQADSAAKQPVLSDGAAKAARTSDTAAAMFQKLIREGRLTDDKIFEAVQKKFDLDDSKRTYVAWYRNYLRKRGETVPDSK